MTNNFLDWFTVQWNPQVETQEMCINAPCHWERWETSGKGSIEEENKLYHHLQNIQTNIFQESSYVASLSRYFYVFLYCIDKIYSNDFSLFLKLSGINPLPYKIV